LSDPRPFSAGEQGRTGRRNAMPLFNLAWKPSFFWDGRAASLREQVLVPVEDHQELAEDLTNVVRKLGEDPRYGTRFTEAFGSPGISADRLAIALETFLLSLVSYDSKFDRAQRCQGTLTDLEQRGFELFMTEREPRSGQFGGDCFHCHGGALFTDHQFRNNGLAIDAADPGRGEVTGLALDQGIFSTPSLRNIALTAPYMHDGRFATLEDVLDHYSEGVQRTQTLDPNLAKHPEGGLGLSKDEKAALIAFLRTLTDDQFARDAYAEED
jgi:cytochrome c peroxidase